jgi:hypothetical protein
MSFASVSTDVGASPAERAFAQQYDESFTTFIRQVVGPGVPVHDRAMEAAHERATQAASQACQRQGYRNINFAPHAQAGMARMMRRYGY